jgi:phosphoribosyl 1,2-cyclic phosphodiesterase
VIVRVLGSGSKGNAVLIEAGDTRVLIDAGFTPGGMKKRLDMLEVAPSSIEAVIVTHEHADHIKGVTGCAQRWGWRVLATAGTRSGYDSMDHASVETIPTSRQFSIGRLDISTFDVSHDANEPMAVVATAKDTGARAAIVYDLGVLTQALLAAIHDVDILMIEANHDMDMLHNGPYPPILQRRIAGRYGHLSNDDAATAAAESAHKGLRHVILAHLSQKNNTPQVATCTIESALRRTGFSGQVTAAAQGRVTGPFVLAGMSFSVAGQLDLGL